MNLCFVASIKRSSKETKLSGCSQQPLITCKAGTLAMEILAMNSTFQAREKVHQLFLASPLMEYVPGGSFSQSLLVLYCIRKRRSGGNEECSEEARSEKRSEGNEECREEPRITRDDISLSFNEDYFFSQLSAVSCKSVQHVSF